MRGLHILLVVRINPLLLVFICLYRLFHKVVLGHRSKISLHFAIVKDLVSSNFLELHGIQLILFLLLVFHHVGFADLHFALQIDLVNMVLIKALKVIWLHTVWRQHAHLSLRVLSHEIMIIGIFKLMLLELCPRIVHRDFPLLLLLGEDLIDVVGVDLVLRPRLIVVLLSLLQDLVEFQRLLVKEFVNGLLQ